jgi:hypothetical protein
MIAEANRDIRWALRVADKKRTQQHTNSRPYVYLDELIVRLEALHLKGFTNVPRSFLPRLQAISQLLPPELEAPSLWRRRIARAIDQCFELQERVLQLRRKSSKC